MGWRLSLPLREPLNLGTCADHLGPAQAMAMKVASLAVVPVIQEFLPTPLLTINTWDVSENT